MQTAATLGCKSANWPIGQLAIGEEESAISSVVAVPIIRSREPQPLPLGEREVPGGRDLAANSPLCRSDDPGSRCIPRVTNILCARPLHCLIEVDHEVGHSLNALVGGRGGSDRMSISAQTSLLLFPKAAECLLLVRSLRRTWHWWGGQLKTQ